MQSLEELNDSQILSSEIQEYRVITKGKLEPLLLKCAEKLALNYEDKSVIAQRLCRIFPEQKRTIYRVVPDNYKRGYEKSEEVIPKTQLEELFSFREENFKIIYEITKDISKKISGGKYTDIPKLIEDMTSTGSSLDDLIEVEKKINAELSIVKSLGDIREKIHPFQSLVLRAHLFVSSLHEVAEKIDQSTKWMNKGHKENAEELVKMLSTQDNLKRCIVCDWDSAEFFNKNLENEKRGLEFEIPNTSQIKSGFKDSKLIEDVAHKTGNSTEIVSEILTGYFNEVKSKISKKFEN
jgi:hypothetical protein